MAKINRHIEIVRSTKVRLSSMSQESCDAIFAALSRRYARVGVTIVNNLSDLEALVALSPDLVFIGMKFVLSEPRLDSPEPAKIWLTGYLDKHGIAYTGSSQMSHKLEFNKALAKQCALDAGLMTSPFYVIKQNQAQNTDGVVLKFPLFVKPTNLGGGEGIDSNSVVNNYSELDAKVHLIATELQSDSLVEGYLPGREFSVAILKDEDSAEFSVMPIELIAPPDKHGARILSQGVKSADIESFVEVKDEIIKSKITALAIDVFHALGARDYGRIDIRLDEVDTPHFLEANLIPSLISGYGNFPKACLLNMNMGYEAMIMRIAELGLARNLEDAPEPDVLGLVTLPTLIGRAA